MREPVVQGAVAARHRQPGDDRRAGTACRRAPCAGAAAAASTGAEQLRRHPVVRWTGRCRRPSRAPVVSNPACASAASVCSAAPVERRARRLRAIATSRASTSASTLSECGSCARPGRTTGAEATVPSTVAPGAAVPSATRRRVGAEQPGERARPAVSAGSATRGAVLLRRVGAAAVEHQRLDRGDEPAGDVAGSQPSAAASGPGSGWCRRARVCTGTGAGLAHLRRPAR